MSATVPNWLDAKPDRADLVAWLARAATTRRSAFYDAALASVLATGMLNPTAERAVRRARARTMLVSDRDHPEIVGKKAGAGGLR